VVSHASATFTPSERDPVPIGQETWWALEPVWTLPARYSDPSVAIPTVLGSVSVNTSVYSAIIPATHRTLCDCALLGLIRLKLCGRRAKGCSLTLLLSLLVTQFLRDCETKFQICADQWEEYVYARMYRTLIC
jgi:hypothetical protein